MATLVLELIQHLTESYATDAEMRDRPVDGCGNGEGGLPDDSDWIPHCATQSEIRAWIDLPIDNPRA